MDDQICLAEEKRLMRRFHNHVGISIKHSRLLAKHLLYQVKHQGLYRALTYCKNFGQVILEFATKSRSMEKSNLWIKTYKGLPKGFSWISTYSVDVQLVLSKFARIIKFETLQKFQATKCVGAVINVSTATAEGTILLSSLIKRGIDELGLKPYDCNSNVPNIYDAWEKGLMTKGVQKPQLRMSYDIATAVPLLNQLSYINQSFGVVIKDGPQTPYWDGFIGTINGTQEQGGKFRMFASPKAVFQTMLVPVHDYIKVFRDKLVTDCTKDQDKMAEWAQFKLSNDVRVISLDLSSATCRFPLKPQLDMLEALGLPSDMLALLEFVIKGKWQVNSILSELHFPKTLRWVVGQPLGITPSMSMFSLAHNLFLTGICSVFDVDPSSNFRILGDDVEISDIRVADMYRKVLTKCGVPFSLSKSFDSSLYAEGAGYSVMKNIKIRPGKYKTPSWSNHFGVMESGGNRLTIGEMPIKYIEAQEALLWHKGITPDFIVPLSVEDASKFQRFVFISSHLSHNNRSFDLFHCETKLSKDDGIFDLFMSEFPDWPGLSMRLKEIPSAHRTIMDIIPGSYKEWYSDGIQSINLKDTFDRFNDLGYVQKDLRQICKEYYSLAYTSLLLAFDAGDIDHDEFTSLVNNVQDKIVASFYMPPRNRSNDMSEVATVCKYTNKIFKLIKYYEDVLQGYPNKNVSILC